MPRLRPYCSPQMAAEINQTADVLNWPLLNVIGNQQNWHAWLAQYGLQHEEQPLIHKMDSAATTVAMAVADCGICLSYDEIVAPQVAAGQLVAPLEDYVGSTESYYLTHRQDSPLSKAAKVFKDWLLEEVS